MALVLDTINDEAMEGLLIRSMLMRQQMLLQHQLMPLEAAIRKRIRRIQMLVEGIQSTAPVADDLSARMKQLEDKIEQMLLFSREKGKAAAFRTEMKERVEQLKRKGGNCTLYLSHDLDWQGYHVLPLLMDQVWNGLVDSGEPEWLQVAINMTGLHLMIQLRYRFPINVEPNFCRESSPVSYLLTALGGEVSLAYGLAGSEEWTVRFTWKKLCIYSSAILAPFSVPD